MVEPDPTEGVPSVEVRLVVPGSTESARTARIVTADVAARASFLTSEIDELVLAVSELARILIEVAEDELTLDFRGRIGTVSVRGVTTRRSGSSEPRLGRAGRALLASMTDHCEVLTSDDAASFLVVKRATPP